MNSPVPYGVKATVSSDAVGQGSQPCRPSGFSSLKLGEVGNGLPVFLGRKDA